jgi:hypothetical protein
MARATADGLTGTMAVLGLVIEAPNETVTQIGERLHQRFPQARFSRSTAYNALPNLAARGHARRTYCAPGDDRGDRARDRYEATSIGFDIFRCWKLDLRSAHSSALRLREPMDGRLELCSIEDIPRMIQLARREHAAATHLYELAHDLQRQQTLGKYDRQDFEHRLRGIVFELNPDRWSAYMDHFQKMADMLKELQDDIDEAAKRDG